MPRSEKFRETTRNWKLRIVWDLMLEANMWLMVDSPCGWSCGTGLIPEPRFLVWYGRSDVGV
jgi:hypothetical protein